MNKSDKKFVKFENKKNLPVKSDDSENKPDKNPGGRPPVFKSPEVFQACVDAYFKYCDSNIIKVQHAFGKGVTTIETKTPYTVDGLAAFLNVSRQTINNYSKKDKFLDTITRAKTKMSADKLERGLVGCYDPKVLQFDFTNNHDYKLKQEVDTNLSIEIAVINYAQVPGQLSEKVEDAEVINED